MTIVPGYGESIQLGVNRFAISLGVGRRSRLEVLAQNSSWWGFELGVRQSKGASENFVYHSNEPVTYGVLEK